MALTKNIPFWILTVAVFIALIVPLLVQDGMFMDGLIYACVSKNLAHGNGTWWFPMFNFHGIRDTQTYHEHPPLVFWIQSGFFSLLGDSIFTERIYSLITACITAWLMIIIWKLIHEEDSEIKKMGWLPVFFWIIIPVCAWSYQNNMQENTMGIFTLASVYYSLKAIYSNRYTWPHIFMAGAFICLASMSKGVPGLFPMATIFCVWVATRKISFSKMIVFTFVLVLVPVVIYALLILNHSAHENLRIYLIQRVLHRIENEPTTGSRLDTIGRLFSELIPVFIVLLIVFSVFKIKKMKAGENFLHRQNILLFFMLGLCGTIPLMFTLVQKGYFLVPALPFYAIGCALIAAPLLNKLFNTLSPLSKNYKIFLASSLALLTGAVIVSFTLIGKTKRDPEKLHDIYLMGEIIPKNSLIGVDKTLAEDWQFQGYFVRHYNISIDFTKNKKDFFIVDKESHAVAPDGYAQVPVSTVRYTLYRLEEK